MGSVFSEFFDLLEVCLQAIQEVNGHDGMKLVHGKPNAPSNKEPTHAHFF